MSDFKGQKFATYADFFARKKEVPAVDMTPEAMISPCDSLLSLFKVEKDTFLHVKGRSYRVGELLADEKMEQDFLNGLCMIFRLRATDYHHYCYVDDCYQNAAHYVEGMLHSVQPIACEKEPVYKVNRRLISILDTEHFGKIAQIEVGAVLVGGMVHEQENTAVKKGQEMGHFELAGSTIMLFLQENVAKALSFEEFVSPALEPGVEVEVKIGQKIATRK